ncbi:LytR C-terminal domain-containing protein [Microbacterium oleivorans]|uniref:LytR C-terminal domain-containing protein n=1 Tax=Microbacterium oleivorans TaxID=273677 RepID=A0A7D5EWE4_9MICO|nr:LytR C-terminal domain-containing protein [Microbacterium oleivorans]QLD10850.1 LytR C-terminal domain-containing protein [Microbacterium oleivorans]
MPTTTYPKDRFDELPADLARVGAHRAENPRLRASVLLFWSAVAVLVLVAAGIFGTLVVTGRISLFPTSSSTAPAAEAPAAAAPVVDTSYPVLILNATTERGLANSVADVVVAAGWSAETVDAGEAGSQDFPTTTIYYLTVEDEGAARGLAEVIGGADVELSDAYPGPADADGAPGKQLTIVLGADRVEGAETGG